MGDIESIKSCIELVSSVFGLLSLAPIGVIFINILKDTKNRKYIRKRNEQFGDKGSGFAIIVAEKTDADSFVTQVRSFIDGNEDIKNNITNVLKPGEYNIKTCTFSDVKGKSPKEHWDSTVVKPFEEIMKREQDIKRRNVSTIHLFFCGSPALAFELGKQFSNRYRLRFYQSTENGFFSQERSERGAK